MDFNATFGELADFWEDYPEIEMMAMICITAPPTQVSVERLFSFIAFIVNQLRTRLDASWVSKICFIKTNENLIFNEK